MAVAPSSFLKMIFCTYCGKSFGRHEHLERHLLTHTDIKPFSCLNCHRSFTRRDLLNRHYRAIHGVGENVTTTEETPRTSIACENCAKHKTKCDQQTPCGRCASKGWTCQPRARARRKKRIVDTDPKDQANDGTNDQERPRQDSGYCSPETHGNSNDTSKSTQDLPNQRQNSSSSSGSSSFNSPKTPAMTKSQDAWLLSPALPSQAAATAFMGFNMDDYFDPSCMPQTYEPWNLATSFVDEDPLAYMDLLNDLPIMQQPDSGLEFPLMDTTVPITTDINMIMDIGASEGDSKTTRSLAPAASMLPAPRNSQQNLLYLKQCLQNPELWNSCSLPIGDDSNFECKLVVSSLQRSTVEKLTAVTRDILSKTFAGSQSQQSAPGFLFSPAVTDGMVQLPPTPILEYMLRMYANSLSRHYPIASRQVLDVNQIVSSSPGTGSLLALIMIAAGAANIAYHEAQDFAHGMLEACRPSLLEIGERETPRPHDLTLPHAVKLFILQAAWSGDKWQMGTAIGLRAAYTSMLSAQCPETIQSASDSNTRDSSQKVDWRTWLQQEQISRLTYSWVLVDQEIALLNDLAPSCAIADLALPMPDADDIWTAKTFNDWSSALEKEHGMSTNDATPRQQSLSTLFRDFLGQGTLLSTPLTPLSLRLLLQPLQAQVHYYRQLLDCFADSTTPQGRQAMTVATTRVQFNEVRALCQQWVWLAERYLEKNEMCPILQSSFIIFHLIGLNTVTSFQEIERLAKRHNTYGSVSNDELRRVLPRAIEAREEAIAHCGQILRIIRSIPVDERPPWWAAAIYRVGLVLWTDCLRTRESIASAELGRTAFPVDALPPNSPAIIKYLQTHEGTPCLVNRDGSWKQINNATAALQHCIDFCSGDYRSRFTEGECEKLAVLRNHCFVQSKPL